MKDFTNRELWLIWKIFTELVPTEEIIPLREKHCPKWNRFDRIYKEYEQISEKANKEMDKRGVVVKE